MDVRETQFQSSLCAEHMAELNKGTLTLNILDNIKLKYVRIYCICVYVCKRRKSHTHSWNRNLTVVEGLPCPNDLRSYVVGAVCPWQGQTGVR